MGIRQCRARRLFFRHIWITLMHPLRLTLAAMALASTVAHAKPPAEGAEIIEHLEFLGYDASMNSERIAAKHPKELNLLLRKYRGGILTTSFFGGSEYGKRNRTEWAGVLNDLNAKAAAARFYISKNGSMVIEAYYPGSYEKQRFSLFLDAFKLERANLAAHLKALKPFLK